MKFNIFQNRHLVPSTALIILAMLLISVVVFSFFRVKNEAISQLAETRAGNNRAMNVTFTKTVRSNFSNQSIQIWQNTQNVRDTVRFRGFIYAATDGGLSQLSNEGKLVHHFSVLDGLTESDLTCLAVFNDRLFIGTNSTGLLTFDGERFESYVWPGREAKSVNALLPDNGRLLIGTFAGGLIEFDGSRFAEKTAENKSIGSVDFLAKDGQNLFVGTFDNGLWVESGGLWRHFTTASGLLSNRIVGVVADGDKIFVGTDLGIAETNQIEQSDGKPFHPTAGLPTLSSLVKNGNEIFAVKNNGDVFRLVGEKTKTLSQASVIGISPDLTGARLVSLEKDCWLLGNHGVFRRESNSFVRFTDSNAAATLQLASNTISALAVDGSGNIWAGTFRQGIDVFERDGRRIEHLESETMREINFIRSQKEFVWAATNQGAIRFDKSLHRVNLTRTDGLLSDSVNQISVNDAEKAGLFLGTSRGLSFQTDNGWRALTTVNGLPNNSVFTTAFYKNSLFVGTLGGLAEIQNGRVVRTLSDANSKLSHNWITALWQANERLFVGTYGGGVFELTTAGDLRSFAAETGKFIVNPNAMSSDGERLYVGTLQGAWSFDLTTQKWVHLTDELPSQAVLSVASDQENVYFGTTGGIAKINQSYFRAIK